MDSVGSMFLRTCKSRTVLSPSYVPVGMKKEKSSVRPLLHSQPWPPHSFQHSSMPSYISEQALYMNTIVKKTPTPTPTELTERYQALIIVLIMGMQYYIRCNHEGSASIFLDKQREENTRKKKEIKEREERYSYDISMSLRSKGSTYSCHRFGSVISNLQYKHELPIGWKNHLLATFVSYLCRAISTIHQQL